MNTKSKLITILIIILIIIIVTCVVTYKNKKQTTYNERIKNLAKNIIYDML